MKTALVTGGGGFIGSHLTRALLKKGYNVTVIDTFATGRRSNLADIKHDIKLIEVDIRDLEGIKPHFHGVDYVFHLAALPSVPRSIADPLSSHAVNITGTLNVLLAARDAEVKKTIYASSSSAYGNVAVEWKKEDLPAHPLSPYALTKFTAEEYCRIFASTYGLPTLSLRYFNVFGPYQDPASQYSAVIPKFITAMLDGRSPVINGDGTQSRDFTYVANNVHANILAAESAVSGEMLNIACGGSFSLNRVVLMINQALGTNIEPQYDHSRAGDVMHSKADIAKAKQLIGYQPIVDFEQGLKETIAWYKNQ